MVPGQELEKIDNQNGIVSILACVQFLMFDSCAQLLSSFVCFVKPHGFRFLKLLFTCVFASPSYDREKNMRYCFASHDICNILYPLAPLGLWYINTQLVSWIPYETKKKYPIWIIYLVTDSRQDFCSRKWIPLRWHYFFGQVHEPGRGPDISSYTPSFREMDNMFK